MEPVHIITGRAVPLDRSDVDTDQIIPSDWLKRIERTGFGAGLFSEWRDDRDFVLNKSEHAGATIPHRRPELRDWLVPRARCVGARRLRLQGCHQSEVRRHLPQQLHPIRTRARHRLSGRRPPSSSTPSRRTRPSSSPSTSSAGSSKHRRSESSRRSTSTKTHKLACSAGSMTSGSRSSSRTRSRVRSRTERVLPDRHS